MPRYNLAGGGGVCVCVCVCGEKNELKKIKQKHLEKKELGFGKAETSCWKGRNVGVLIHFERGFVRIHHLGVDMVPRLPCVVFSSPPLPFDVVLIR